MQKPKPGALLRIITNSERSTYACHRKWFFRYVLGLTTGDSPTPLRMGTLWHRCLAVMYNVIQQAQKQHASENGCSVLRLLAEQIPFTSPSADTVMTHVELTAIQPWVEQRASYRSGLDEEKADEAAREDEETVLLTRQMFNGYMNAWLASDAASWEILFVEAQVARPLLHPVTRKPLSDMTVINNKRRRRIYHYGGGIDLVIRKPDGSVWFVEHKTTADKDLTKYKRKLYWDPQIRGYAWALRNPIKESDIKEALEPVGVIYNVARKKYPEQPELVRASKKDRELMPGSCVEVEESEEGKTKMVWHRLSKSAIDTTREQFISAILKHGFNPDDYADQLEKLVGNMFFDREHITLSEAELDDFARDVEHDALDKMREVKLSHHTRQTSVCTGHNAQACPYASNVCMQDGAMSRRGFTILGVRHVELHGVLAEEYVAQENVRSFALARTTPRNEVDPFDHDGSSLSPPQEHGIDTVFGD